MNAPEHLEQEEIPEEASQEIETEETELETPEESPADPVEEISPVQEGIPVNVNAVPKMPSLEELLAKAEAAGEKPEVKKDKENEVTLLDYSDIL